MEWNTHGLAAQRPFLPLGRGTRQVSEDSLGGPWPDPLLSAPKPPGAPMPGAPALPFCELPAWSPVTWALVGPQVGFGPCDMAPAGLSSWQAGPTFRQETDAETLMDAKLKPGAGFGQVTWEACLSLLGETTPGMMGGWHHLGSIFTCGKPIEQ